MGKLANDQGGFSLVEGLLVILVLAVIGFGGYYVWHSQKTNKTTESTSTKTMATNTKSTQAVDPYASWQQLCSRNGGLCLKYPSSWKLSGSDSDGYTITSPSGTTAVNYLPNGTPDRGMYGYENAGGCPSNILSVQPLTTNASTLDVVQAITNCTANVNANVTSFTPSSSVIPASAVTSQGIKAGSTDSNSLDITLVNSNASSPTRQLLYLSNLSNATYGTSSAAQKWFSNTDVQTAGKILSSTSYNK